MATVLHFTHLVKICKADFELSLNLNHNVKSHFIRYTVTDLDYTFT